MAEILLLRFDAPLMSFGSAIVDRYGVIQDFPGLSMLVGLLGNALGYDHRDIEALQSLQARIRYAARCDRAGEKLTDFHTVDLGQHSLVDTGWTTAGVVEGRKGGNASDGTHIRLRDYWADAVFTIALCLLPPAESPAVHEIEAAMRSPARPLFLGRKCCMPSAPIVLGVRNSDSVLDALRSTPSLGRGRSESATDETLTAWWPADMPDTGEGPSRIVPVTDARDWLNQIHGGRRLMRHGVIRMEADQNV